MNEMVPGIYQIKLPLPGIEPVLGYVNVYVIRGDGSYLLVDGGLNTHGALASLEKQMAEFGAAVKDISQIVVTHIHPDHYGLVGQVKQLSGASFYLHELEEALVDSRYVHMEDLLQKMADWLHINGVPADDLPTMKNASLSLARFIRHVRPDVVLHGGETISAGLFSFQVMWTPGHSPGHIVLYEPVRKILITGDHVLPAVTPNVGLHPQSTGNPLGDYLSSLNALKGLDVELVLPGHQGPFTGLKARVEAIVRHHEARNSEILAAINAGASTGYEIAQKITWQTDIGGARWQHLTRWDRRLAVLETLAHLEAMRNDGRVDTFSNNSVTGYKFNQGKTKRR